MQTQHSSRVSHTGTGHTVGMICAKRQRVPVTVAWVLITAALCINLQAGSALDIDHDFEDTERLPDGQQMKLYAADRHLLGTTTCSCSSKRDPVCAVINKTYQNACIAQCAGVQVRYNGTCTPGGHCGCPRDIWQPVCVGHTTYQNQCMAQCDKQTKWKRGKCNCVCDSLWDPYCGRDNKTYSNACELSCAGIARIYKGACDGRKACICQTYFNPVCGANNRSYANSCQAKCGGQKHWTSGACKLSVPQPSPPPSPPPCGCPTDSITVCGSNNNTYGNACLAQCANATVNHLGACGKPALICQCYQDFSPVCVGNTTYSNPCNARCAGWPAQSQSPGTCPGQPTPPAPPPPPSYPGCEEQASIIDPICVLRNGANATQELQNPCFAQAAGVNLTAGDRMQRGHCSEECDKKCNPLNGTDLPLFINNATTQPVCCAPGAEYINWCYASCMTHTPPPAVFNKCYKGQCRGQRAVALVQSAGCSEGGIQADCLPGPPPCSNATRCAADPAATCVPAGDCTKYFRLDLLDSFCGRYWITTAGDLMLDKECASDDSSPPPDPSNGQPPIPVPGSQSACSNMGAACTIDPYPLPPHYRGTRVPCCSPAKCSSQQGSHTDNSGVVWGSCA